LPPLAAPGAALTAAPAAAPKAADDPASPDKLRGLLGAARAAVGQGDLKTAIERFQDYLRLNPSDVKVRREYTGILIRAKELNLAAEQYKLLLKTSPDAETHLGLANIYLQLRQPRPAIPELIAALRLAPTNTLIATRLARAYLGDSEPHNAKMTFERYLTGVQPTDAVIPPRFARLLLDLSRPKQAMRFLPALQKQHPDDPELVAEEIRANAWLGYRAAAAHLIAKLAGVAPKDFLLRLELADALFRLTEYQLAGKVYSQALQVQPGNLRALLGIARVDVAMYDVVTAAKFLEGCQAATAPAQLLSLARGELYLVTGKYAEAVTVLKCYLQHDEDDVDCRATLAKVYEATQDYEKAKAEWAKLGLIKGQTERSLLGVALMLGARWKLAESNAVCERVLAEEPESYTAVLQMVRNYGKMKQVDKALATGEAWMATPHEDEAGVAAVGLTLGQALLENKHYPEALRIYQALLAMPLGRVPAAYFGAYYAEHHHHADPDDEAVLQPVLSGTFRDLMQLADAASAFDLNDLVEEACMPVLSKFPQHLPALLRVAEAQLRQARFTAHIEAVVTTCKAVLTISPTNVRGRFTLARAYSMAQQYPASFLEYKELIRTDANLMQAWKEYARVLYGANCNKVADLAYQTAQYPSGEEVLQNALAHLNAQKATAYPLPGALSAPGGTAPPSAHILPPPLHSAGGPTTGGAIPVSAAEPAAGNPAKPSRALLAGKAATDKPASRPAQEKPATAAPPPSSAAAKNQATLEKILAASTDPGAAASKQAGLDLILASAAESPAPAEILPPPLAGPPETSGSIPLADAGPQDADQEAACQRRLKRVTLDAEARAADASDLHQEQFAKALKGNRNREAAGALGTLLSSQPDNTSAMFDLVEMYGALKLTNAAINQDQELLWHEPFNRDAAVVQEHASAVLQPTNREQYDQFFQNGRNGLARIEINRYSTQAVCTFGDEGDYIGAGYQRVALVPHNYPILTGNIPYLLLGKQWGDQAEFVGRLNAEEYTNRISTKPTFDATFYYHVNDCWTPYVNGFLQNVLQNGESIAQNIYTTGGTLGSDFHFNQNLDGTLYYRLTGYSDNNYSHNAFARLIYRFLPPPYELKFISSAYFLSFDETNPLSQTNSNIAPPTLSGFRHPYFAPLDFWYWEERVTWKQTLSRDLFKYSDQIFYQLEYGLGLDNRDNIYNNFKVILNYDFNAYIRVGASAETMFSPVYNAATAFAFIELRCPCFHH
jgi:predicted Zn-dependent protease